MTLSSESYPVKDNIVPLITSRSEVKSQTINVARRMYTTSIDQL